MRIPALLHQANFRSFFLGQSASMLGDQVSVLAIPLTAVLVLHAGPGQLGLLTAVSLLPSLLFSLLAGALIDRRGNRRQTMLVADWIRAAAMLSLPVAYSLDVLTLAQLYLVAFVVGTLDVAFFVSYNALIVALVEPGEYVEANALLNGSRSVAGVLGLTLGGSLVSLLSAPGALLVDAVSFAVSGLGIGRAKVTEPPPEFASGSGIGAGARYLAGSPVIRTMLLSTAWVNLFTFVGNAILVLYATRTLHLGPGLIGLAFGASAVGGVLGALTATRLEGRIGLGPAFVVGSFLFPLPLLLVPLAHGPQTLAVALLLTSEFLSSLGVIWLDVTSGAIFAQLIPNGMRARVSGAYRTVNYGVRPVGALIGGGLGEAVGLRATMWVYAVGASCAGLPLLRRAILELRSAPRRQPAAEPAAKPTTGRTADPAPTTAPNGAPRGG
ncbi:MAG: MFS transporter [Jatrophihabitans sp.]